MEVVLPIVLANTPSNTFNFKDFVRLRAASRLTQFYIDDHIRFLHGRYEQLCLEIGEGKVLNEARPVQRGKMECGRCGCHNKRRLKYEAFSKSILCYECLPELVTLTLAKKDYKLTDRDLECLPRVMRYSYLYKRYMTLFHGHDIIGLAMMKHKCICYTSLLLMLTAPRISKAASKRRQQLLDLCGKLKVAQSDMEGLNVVKSFLENGQGGIRSLYKVVERYCSLRTAWEVQEDDVKKALDESEIQDYTHLTATEFITTLIDRRNAVLCAIRAEEEHRCLVDLRRRQLERALAERGLLLREDSELCRSFVTHGSKTLEEVVAIMESMEFLHRHTSYPMLIKCELDAAYGRARELIHLEHGYVKNAQQFNAMLNEHIDRAELSKHCQMIAIKRYVQDGFRFDAIPAGLHHLL